MREPKRQGARSERRCRPARSPSLLSSSPLSSLTTTLRANPSLTTTTLPTLTMTM